MYDTDISAIQVGCVATCAFTLTEEDVISFARLSQDTNPLHIDPVAAREFGFPRPVAHGLLTLGGISRLIGTELPGPGALWVSQDVQFLTPVLVGDQLSARVEVMKVSKAAGIVVLRTEVLNRNSNTRALIGTAKVKVLQYGRIAI
jgi:acyl dehydratase